MMPTAMPTTEDAIHDSQSVNSRLVALYLSAGLIYLIIAMLAGFLLVHPGIPGKFCV